MPPSLSARRDRCRDNRDRTNEYANWANDRANDANNHANNTYNSVNDARSFWNQANNLLPQVRGPADDAETLVSRLRSSIQTHASKIIPQTPQEKTALDKLVSDANPEINRIEAIANLGRNAATSAINDVNSKHGYIHQELRNARGHANAARYYAGEARKYADQCKNTARRGDGGDDKRSNNERSACESSYNNAISQNNEARNISENDAWPRRQSAAGVLNNVINQINIARQALENTSRAIEQSTAIKAVLKSITDYGNDHNYDWLYAEIARITPLKDTLEKVTLPKDKTEEKDIKKIETDANTKLGEEIKKLNSEMAKGSLSEQTSKELEDLEKELKLCTDKIDEYKKSYELTKGSIGELAAQLVNEETNLTNAETNKKNKFDEMINVEKKYNDLSGELIKLQTDKITLEGLITSEETKYNELKHHVDNLHKKIIDLNIQHYSNKVYNNENLLELNQTIDKDLQNIFSHLKTENINPDLLYTKTNYRRIEEEKLSNTDKLLDVLFYCFYFSFIIIRIVTKNTQIEDFLMYILIGIIPLIYPFVYKNSKYIIHLFHLDMNKNAFIETETEHEISIDAYNI
jgi:chromosome segregation ATPase